MRQITGIYWRRLGTVVLLILVPGISAFLLARARLISPIEPARGLDINGVQIPQATIDIGTVWSGGQTVQRDFELTNRTGHQIRIESVVSDCGCTVPTIISSKVDNEQSTKILVVFRPPSVASDQGIEFLRTITATIDTFKGKIALNLFLTGLVEPDESLRVFPVNVKLDAPNEGAILHFKGSVSLLNSIPDTLVVSPGRNQRVQVQLPAVGQADLVGTKDVKVSVAGNSKIKEVGDWASAITFAPDANSDGLTIRFSCQAPQSVFVTPASLVLTDGSLGNQATVRLTSKGRSLPTPDSVFTDLPLALDFLANTSNGENFRTLRVRVTGSLPESMAGTVKILLNPKYALKQVILIPVVILHEERGNSLRASNHI
jgi:Protein of unknown function (DUF1573)